MTIYTPEEKTQIVEVRAKLTEIEEKVKASPWLKNNPTLDGFNGHKSILKEVSLIRDHISSGRTDPDIQMIYDRMFSHSGSMPTLDKCLEQLPLKVPGIDSVWNRDQIPRAIVSYIGWSTYNGQPIPPPKNASLPPEHPDKTDRFGYPYYLPVDEKGDLVPGFAPASLSMLKEAVDARQNNGVAGHIRHREQGGVLEWDRIKIPRDLSENAKRQYQRQLENERLYDEREKKDREEESKKYHEEHAKRAPDTPASSGPATLPVFSSRP